MHLKNRNLILSSTALIMLLACSKSSSTLCDCDNVVLPTPEKVVRSRMGFTPVKIEATIDFTTGKVDYNRIDQIDASSNCEGSISIQEQLESWKQASQISACFGEVKNPITDGTLDTVTLYYPQNTTLPQGLKTFVDGEWITVKLHEKLNDSIQGQQQFDCTGSFAMDALIADRISCLNLE